MSGQKENMTDHGFTISSTTPDGAPAWLHVYLRKWMMHAKCNNDNKLREFSLTFDELWDIASAQNFRCAITGREFDNPLLKYESGRRRHPFGPSVDRIDCHGGYTKGNVRLVCVIVNLALNNFGYEAFFEMCALMRSTNGRDAIPKGRPQNDPP